MSNGFYKKCQVQSLKNMFLEKAKDFKFNSKHQVRYEQYMIACSNKQIDSRGFDSFRKSPKFVPDIIMISSVSVLFSTSYKLSKTPSWYSFHFPSTYSSCPRAA